MPIWTQEQLLEQIKSSYIQVKEAEGKAKPEEIANAIKQLETMETWLDVGFRNELDEHLNRI